jgi:5-methylcytosine-specific restriction endonuclease McrA
VKRSELKRSTPLKSATGWSATDAPRKPLKRSKPKSRPKIARDGIRLRQGWRCLVCKALSVRLEVHHVLPLRLWPEHGTDEANLVALCPQCHARHESAFRRIRYEELPEQVRTWVRTFGGRENLYLERTYPRA